MILYNIIPFKVNPINLKFYKTTQTAYILGLFFHITITIIFYLLQVPELVYFNIFGSIVFFLFAIAFNRLGFVNLAFAIAFSELYVHQVITTYYLGWGFGMHFWLIYLSGLGFFNPTWGKKVQIFQLTLITSTYAFLYLNYQNGIYSFPPNIINLSYVVNSILAISIISLLINGYTKSAHKAEEELKLTIQNLDLAQKEARSLLLNILPESIADRLTESKNQIADSVEFATILFTDLVGFTPIASKMTAQEVVGILNDIFYEFDSIVERHGLEKIKTIGDGYMVASGVPKFRDDHAISAVQCGFCMLEFLNSFNLKMNLNLGLRIGISSGPIVAGVIGKNKFTYDLWGDTVNTASRMESYSQPGKIHISQSCYDLISDRCEFESRGEIEIKGKGKMKTYFVVRIL